MSISLIITLIVIGLILLLLEIFVIPGTGIAGILGFAMVFFAIYKSYKDYDNPTGHYILVATLVVTFALLYFSFKSKTWKNTMLKSSINSKVNIIDKNLVKQGDIGKTVSRLAPSGKATINGVLYEVHTTGGFIDEKSEIIVLKIELNKIIVKLKN
jgi:membrane-bound ClpP family serine protease